MALEASQRRVEELQRDSIDLLKGLVRAVEGLNARIGPQAGGK